MFYVCISFCYLHLSCINLILLVFSRATVSAFNCLVVLPPLLIVLAVLSYLANKLMMKLMKYEVGWLKSNLHPSRIFVRFGSKVDNDPLWISTDTKNDHECPIHLKVRFLDDMSDLRRPMLWLSELTMLDWTNMVLNCHRQKCGRWNVVSEHRSMRFVRIFARVYCIGGDEPELAIFLLNAGMQRHFSDILRCVDFCDIKNTFFWKVYMPHSTGLHSFSTFFIN